MPVHNLSAFLTPDCADIHELRNRMLEHAVVRSNDVYFNDHVPAEQAGYVQSIRAVWNIRTLGQLQFFLRAFAFPATVIATEVTPRQYILDTASTAIATLLDTEDTELLARIRRIQGIPALLGNKTIAQMQLNVLLGRDEHILTGIITPRIRGRLSKTVIYVHISI